MNELVYLVGPPGVGKSTAMALLTRDCMPLGCALQPFAYDLLQGPDGTRAARLGANRPGGFSGTDALPMNVQPKAVSWLAVCPFKLVLGEGDRLGNVKFFQAALVLGWRLHLVGLTASQDELEFRRRVRGSNQNPTWMRGRQTKVDNVLSWAIDAQRESPDRLRVHTISTTAGAWRTAEAIQFLVPPLQGLHYTHSTA